MGFLQDPIGQKHALYFFCLFCTWVACCVVFGGELHRADISDLSTVQEGAGTRTTRRSGSYYFNYDKYYIDEADSTYTTGANGANSPVSTFTVTGSVNYHQCGSATLNCDKCYSGGAGAVAMTVFAWFGCVIVCVLRALVLAQKHDQLPVIGHDNTRYALVERITNIVVLCFYLLAIISWGGGCIAATATADGVSKVIPTGLVYIVLCIASASGAIVLIGKIHEETAFTSGGSAGGSGGAAKPAAAAAPASAV